MKLSAVVLTKNEEKNIKECLKCLKFCDEVILVDDNSTDKTVQIAKKLGAKVYSRSMNKDYAAQSNFGMDKAKNEWIFFFDADERITPKLESEIKKAIENNNFQAYKFKRIDYMWGKWLKHGESGASRVQRLVKKRSGKWKRRIHSYFVMKGMIGELKNPILHYPHPTVSKFLISINRWSTWHYMANIDEGKKPSFFKVILWPHFHFCKNYFLRLGFLDGTQGFVYAVLMSFHSFLAWSQQWSKN